MSYATFHWWLFNKLARLFGVMAVFVGTGFVAWAVYYFLQPEASADVNALSGNACVDFLVTGLFSFLLGVLILRAKLYEPRVPANK